MDTSQLSRDLPRVTMSVLAVVSLLAGTFWVMQPFLPSLLWATTIVVSTWPVMQAVERRCGGRRGVAVAVMCVGLLMVLVVPLSMLIAAVAKHAEGIAKLAGSLGTMEIPPPPTWVENVPLIGKPLSEAWADQAEAGREALATQLAPYASQTVRFLAARAGSVGTTLVYFLLTVAISGMLYANGERVALGVRRFFRRLASERGEEAVLLAGKAVRAVALGVIVTAAAQTVLAAAGLMIAGIPRSGVLSLVIAALCIVQAGPGLVLIPSVIWLFVTGSTGMGVFLAIWSVATLSIDNVLRPFLIKRGADLPLWLIFAGVIGGLLGFGIIGLFIGPVILAVCYTLVQSWVDQLGPEAESAGEARAV